MKTTMRFAMVFVLVMLASAMAKGAEPMKPIPPMSEVEQGNGGVLWGDDGLQTEQPAPKAQEKAKAPKRKVQTFADVLGQVIVMFAAAVKELPQSYNGPDGMWPKPGNPNALRERNPVIAQSPGAFELRCNDCK